MQPVVAAELAENIDFGCAHNKVIVNPSTRIWLSSGRLVDARQGVFNLVLFDDPDAPYLFELRERDQLNVADFFGAVVANMRLRFEHLA